MIRKVGATAILTNTVGKLLENTIKGAVNGNEKLKPITNTMEVGDILFNSPILDIAGNDLRQSLKNDLSALNIKSNLSLLKADLRNDYIKASSHQSSQPFMNHTQQQIQYSNGYFEMYNQHQLNRYNSTPQPNIAEMLHKQHSSMGRRYKLY